MKTPTREELRAQVREMMKTNPGYRQCVNCLNYDPETSICLHEGARLPKKATEGSATYDLYLTEDEIIKPGRQVIPLGFAMEMPEGIQALIDPRSGFSSKGMEGYEVLASWEKPQDRLWI